MKKPRFFSGQSGRNIGNHNGLVQKKGSGLLVPADLAVEECTLEFIHIDGQRILAHNRGRFFILDVRGVDLTPEVIEELKAGFKIGIPIDAPTLATLPVEMIAPQLPVMIIPIVMLVFNKKEAEQTEEQPENKIIC